MDHVQRGKTYDILNVWWKAENQHLFLTNTKHSIHWIYNVFLTQLKYVYMCIHMQTISHPAHIYYNRESMQYESAHMKKWSL